MTTRLLQLMTIMTLVMVITVGQAMDVFADGTIRLTSGADVETVVDQSVDDTNGVDGITRTFATVGVFDLDMTATTNSKPLVGSPTVPRINTILDVTSSAPGTLFFEFTDTGFTGNKFTCKNFGAGNTPGTLTYDVWIDPGNGEFVQTTKIFGPSVEGPGVISIDLTDIIEPNGLFSITTVAQIDHDGNDETSSFGIRVECNPEEDETEIFKTSDCPVEFGIYSLGAVQCSFTITYTNTDPNAPPVRILDTLHAEFRVLGTNAVPGVVILFTTVGAGTTIQWDLPAGTTSATLVVDIETVPNVGKGHGKKGDPVFKPTSCGPLLINDGATVFEFDPNTNEIKLDANGEPVVILGPSNMIIRQASDVPDDATKDCEPPKTIQNLTITQGDPDSGVLILDWDDNGDAALTGYNIYQDEGCDEDPTLLASIGTSPSSYTDSGLMSGTEYCYIVTAVSPAGESTDSKKVSQSETETAP